MLLTQLSGFGLNWEKTLHIRVLITKDPPNKPRDLRQGFPVDITGSSTIGSRIQVEDNYYPNGIVSIKRLKSECRIDGPVHLVTGNRLKLSGSTLKNRLTVQRSCYKRLKNNQVTTILTSADMIKSIFSSSLNDNTVCLR